MTDAFAEITEQSVQNISSSIVGYLDSVEEKFISGWALDRLSPEKRLNIEIRINNEVLGVVTADRFREDLSTAGFGDGAHAFEFSNLNIPDAGSKCTIRAIVAENGVELTGSPRVFHPRAANIVDESLFAGRVDKIDPFTIEGWIQSKSAPEDRIYIELSINNQAITCVRADRYRSDLQLAGMGDGYHCFEIPTPAVLLDSKRHQVTLKAANSTFVLYDEMRRIESPLPMRYIMDAREIITTTKAQIDALNDRLLLGTGHGFEKNIALASSYEEWFARYGTLTEIEKASISSKAAALKTRPKFSIVMPTYNTPAEMLAATVGSVQGQLYDNWELCIADDASTTLETVHLLRKIEGEDERIRICYRPTNGHIAEATNSAFTLATGDYVCFLDHDDLLAPDALYQIACELNSGDYDILYSDEDKIDSFGKHHDPHFKTQFNYTLLLSYNYICHLLCVKRALAVEVGDLRSEMNGAQDYDFLLRCVERTELSKIRHIPIVLYHWRVHPGSTAASGSAKEYAANAGQMAIQSHLDRINSKAKAEVANVYSYRVRWPAAGKKPPLVSVIIPTRDCAAVLSTCLFGLLHETAYPNIEVIILNNASVEEETFRLFDISRRDKRVTVIDDNRPFNFSEICNLGAQKATGNLLLMLNNDIEIISAEWLDEMVSQVLRRGVGAVGARLLYPDGRLQHGGVLLGLGGVAGHAHKLLGRTDPGYMARAIVAQELSACTAACLLLRRDAFDKVGGFNEDQLAVAFNDVDLCLKLRDAGYSIVYTPFAELYHHESFSRGLEDTPSKSFRARIEAKYIKEKWSTLLDNDPFYSPNLTLNREDLSIDPQRGVKRTV